MKENIIIKISNRFHHEDNRLKDEQWIIDKFQPTNYIPIIEWVEDKKPHNQLEVYKIMKQYGC